MLYHQLPPFPTIPLDSHQRFQNSVSSCAYSFTFNETIKHPYYYRVGTYEVEEERFGILAA